MFKGVQNWVGRKVSHYGNQGLDIAGTLTSGALAFQQAAADEKGPAIGLAALSLAFVVRATRREMAHARPQA